MPGVAAGVQGEMTRSTTSLIVVFFGVPYEDGVAAGAFQEQAELYLDGLPPHCDEKRAGKPIVTVFIDYVYTAQKALVEFA